MDLFKWIGKTGLYLAAQFPNGHTVTLADVRPSVGYGEDAQRALQYMDQVVSSFHRWGQILDEESHRVRNTLEIQVIDNRIQELRSRGMDALESTHQMVASYEEFASLQAERLLHASQGSGTLSPDARLSDIAAQIKQHGADLGSYTDAMRESLTELSSELDALRLRKQTTWKKIKGFLVRLLRLLSLLSAAAAAILCVTPGSQYTAIPSAFGLAADRIADDWDSSTKGWCSTLTLSRMG